MFGLFIIFWAGIALSVQANTEQNSHLVARQDFTVTDILRINTVWDCPHYGNGLTRYMDIRITTILSSDGSDEGPAGVARYSSKF